MIEVLKNLAADAFIPFCVVWYFVILFAGPICGMLGLAAGVWIAVKWL